MKKRRKPGQVKDGAGEVGEGASGSMRTRYAFTGGVRGKYAARYEAGSNVIVLDPDIAEVFRTSADVNKALRGLLRGTS